MNFIKLKKSAAKNANLAGLFTLVFIAFTLVFWGVGKVGIASEFFQYVAEILAQCTFGLLIATGICHAIKVWAETKICKGLPKRMY